MASTHLLLFQSRRFFESKLISTTYDISGETSKINSLQHSTLIAEHQKKKKIVAVDRRAFDGAKTVFKPISTTSQIEMCCVCFLRWKKRRKKNALHAARWGSENCWVFMLTSTLTQYSIFLSSFHGGYVVVTSWGVLCKFLSLNVSIFFARLFSVPVKFSDAFKELFWASFILLKNLRAFSL